jgi:hypothetical protein
MNRHLAFDIAERVVWTFVQAFSGVMTGSTFFDWGIPAWQAAAGAGLAAVFSTLKGVAAGRLNKLGTASTLPIELVPEENK